MAMANIVENRGGRFDGKLLPVIKSYIYLLL